MGGAARNLAVVGIALAGVLVFGLLVAVVAYEDAKPYVEREFPTDIYERDDDCRATPCFATLARDTFVVARGMREVNFVIYTLLDQVSGPARVTITDPSGDVRYERVFAPDATLGSATQDSATWSAELGDWTVARSYVGTVGTLAYDAWGIGLPPGTLD